MRISETYHIAHVSKNWAAKAMWHLKDTFFILLPLHRLTTRRTWPSPTSRTSATETNWCTYGVLTFYCACRPEFKGVIDYIFVSKDKIHTLGVLGPIENTWMEDHKPTGFPCPQVASDHLPLVADIELIFWNDIPSWFYLKCACERLLLLQHDTLA